MQLTISAEWNLSPAAEGGALHILDYKALITLTGDEYQWAVYHRQHNRWCLISRSITLDICDAQDAAERQIRIHLHASHQH